MGISDGVIAIFGGIVIIILVILSMPYLGGISLISSQSSANLTSTGGAFSELIPFFAVFIAGGIIITAMMAGRK